MKKALEQLAAACSEESPASEYTILLAMDTQEEQQICPLMSMRRKRQ